MTELERYEPAAQPIDSWVEVLAPVGDLAGKIAGTAFVPDALRGSAPAVAAAILTGRELGIGPMTALRHVNVIKGRPGQSAELMRALIQRDGHHLRYVETTDTRCVVEGRRRGEEDWTRVTFTADQAKKAGIDLGKYPEDKLVARATSRLARRVFADVVAGMPYITEELEDLAPGDSGGGAAPAPLEEAQPRRTAQRATRRKTPAAPPQTAEPSTPAEPADPPLPGEPGYEETDTQPAPDLITAAQLQMLHTTFTELGVNDRDERLATASEFLSRDISSSKELSKDEASSLISSLTLRIAARDDHADEQLPIQEAE